ncbi:MAG: hypothetical protein V4482_00275 [Pseudomonadota bacterium]
MNFLRFFTLLVVGFAAGSDVALAANKVDHENDKSVLEESCATCAANRKTFQLCGQLPVPERRELTDEEYSAGTRAPASPTCERRKTCSASKGSGSTSSTVKEEDRAIVKGSDYCVIRYSCTIELTVLFVSQVENTVPSDAGIDATTGATSTARAICRGVAAGVSELTLALIDERAPFQIPGASYLRWGLSYFEKKAD